MDVYHIWCNLQDGVHDLAFVEAVRHYLEQLKAAGQLESYRITRRKLGLGPPQLPEFHIALDFVDLAHLDAAFTTVSSRREPIEGLHHAVNAKVRDVIVALYRDFPDAHRVQGQEQF